MDAKELSKIVMFLAGGFAAKRPAASQQLFDASEMLLSQAIEIESLRDQLITATAEIYALRPQRDAIGANQQ
jgi:hypothetical protein